MWILGCDDDGDVGDLSSVRYFFEQVGEKTNSLNG